MLTEVPCVETYAFKSGVVKAMKNAFFCHFRMLCLEDKVSRGGSLDISLYKTSSR